MVVAKKSTAFGIDPFLVAKIFLVGQDLLFIEASRSHSVTPHTIGLLWTNDQPIGEIYT